MQQFSTEYDKLRNLVNQVAHDICSPITSLYVIIKVCEDKLPQHERELLYNALENISNIASQLLDHSINNSAKKNSTLNATLQLPLELQNLASTVTTNIKKPTIVLIDDNKTLLDALQLKLEADEKEVITYDDPQHFLKQLAQYSKDTKICMDNNFNFHELNGLELAKHLYATGYTNLYLFSGDDFINCDIPNYLTVIKKSAPEKLLELL